MKGNLLSLAVIVLLLMGSFGAVGNQLEKEEDCGCDDETITNFEDEARGLGLIDLRKHDPPGDKIFPTDAPLGNFDWRDNNGNWLTSVKNQGSCGSCWAFATIGVVESVINIKNNDPNLNLDLSEQYMVSCCDYNADGCNGAITSPLIGPNYLEWTKIFDAIPEDKFDYSGTEEPCGNKDSDFYKYKAEVKNWGWVDGSIDQMKNALVQEGPLHATMSVYDDFYSDYPDDDIWPDDVYYHHHGNKIGGHAVIIVGYGSNYWICKNSWGSYWGLDGYFKIKFGEVGINDNLAYLEVDKYVDPDDATVTLELYKIKALDELEGPFDEEDWAWQVAAGGSGKSDRWEDNHNTINKIQSYRWDTTSDIVDITLKLKEIDDGPFMLDDLADVGEKHDAEPYDNQEPSWSNFPRPVYFKVTLDRNQADLEDALTGDRYDSCSESGWSGYKTSGNFDGGSGDENDAEMWFNIEYKCTAIPDLSCDGSLSWNAVKPGSTVTNSFTLKNNGDTGSELDWKIDSYPDWGTWTFKPSYGDNLKPEDGEIEVEVTVKAPNEPLETYTGLVVVINKEDSSDKAVIPCLLVTPRNKQVYSQLLFNIFEKFPMLQDLFLILKNGGFDI